MKNLEALFKQINEMNIRHNWPEGEAHDPIIKSVLVSIKRLAADISTGLKATDSTDFLKRKNVWEARYSASDCPKDMVLEKCWLQVSHRRVGYILKNMNESCSQKIENKTHQKYWQEGQEKLTELYKELESHRTHQIPLFGQAQCNTHFQCYNTYQDNTYSGFPKQFADQDIRSLGPKLRNGEVGLDQIIINFFPWKGNHYNIWVAINNRSMAAHALAEILPLRLIPTYPSQAELNRLEEIQQPSSSIILNDKTLVKIPLENALMKMK